MPEPSARSNKLRDATPAAIAEAAELLCRGGLVGMPTETVYGLAADATSEEAVARLYAAKARPVRNPLIAHVSDLDAAKRQGLFSPSACALADAFWPGPLTLVVPARADATVCAMARAQLPSLALRVPAHAVTRDLIGAAGRPLAAPSANRSGRLSPVSAGHVLDDLGDAIDLVLDAGRCEIGVESTIVACLDDNPRLLRAGGHARDVVEDRLGRPLGANDRDAGVIAPGALASHYAPRARLRLNATSCEVGDVVLDFAGQIGAGTRTLDLSPRGDLVEASHNLFAHLRALDAMEPSTIVVAPIPHFGLGEALNDRLLRAAAPRD